MLRIGWCVVPSSGDEPATPDIESDVLTTRPTRLTMLVGGSAGGDIHNIALALHTLYRPDTVYALCVRTRLDCLRDKQVRGYCV